MKTSRTMLNKLFTGVLAGVFASLSPLVFAAESALPAASRNMDYAQVLPANVAGMLVVNNAFRFVNADVQTPAARLFNHPAVQALMKDSAIKDADLPSEKELEDIFGITSKDLPRLFSGKAAIAMVLVDKDMTKGAGVSAVTVVSASAKTTSDGDVTPISQTKVEAKINKDVSVLGLVEFIGSPAEFDRLVGRLRDELKKKHPESSLIQEKTGGITLCTLERMAKPGEDDEDDEAADGEEESGATNATAAAKSKSPAKPETKKIYFTLAHDTVVISPEKDLLLDTVRALARGVTTKPLSGDSEFIAVKQEMGTSDGYFILNLGSIARDMRDQMQAGLANMVAHNAAAQPFVDPKTLLDAVALENFSALYGSVRMDDKKLDVRCGLTWKERVGVASLINFGRQAVTVPRFVSTDYKGIDASTVDLAATWDSLRALVQKASPAAWPMLTMLTAAKPEISKTLEDLRKGLLDNVEPGYIQLTGYATANPADSEEPGKVFLVKAKDAALALNTINSVLNSKTNANGSAAVETKTKEYLGVKIYQTPPLPLPISAKVKRAKNKEEAGKMANEETGAMRPQMMRVSYAFLDSYLIVAVGSDGMIEGVIANMKNPGKPLATDQFCDAIGSLPGTECGIGYIDIATAIKAGLNEAIRNNTTEVPDEDLVKARASCKDLHFFAASKCYFNDKGVYTRLIVVEEDKKNEGK